MKKIFLFLCMAIVCGYGVAAKPHDVNQIKLQGKLPLPTLLKSAPANPAIPVAAYLDAGDINIVFGSALGSLTVTVVNQQNIPVYRQTVDATAGSRIIVSTQGWSNGSYTLLITSANGGYLEGQFEK